MHTDNHPLIFINSKSKLQEKCHLKWDAYIQQFHLVIKYKKGTSNFLEDLLSRPPPQVLNMVVVRCVADWKPLYAFDPFFCDIWVALQQPTTIN